MSDRLVTLGGALLALIVATGLLFSRVGPSTPPDSRPGSQDAGRNGLLAMYRWLEQSGQPVLRLNRRYDGLARLPLPSSGNLLVVAAPTPIPVREAEGKALADWVSRGNAVLVLGPIPQWAGLRQESAQPLLTALSLRLAYGGTAHAGVCSEFEPTRTPKTLVPDRPQNYRELLKKPPLQTVLRPAAADRAHPLLAGVEQVELQVPAVAMPPSSLYPVPLYQQGKDRLGFAWLCDVERLRAGLSQFRLGAGTVWVSGFGGLFDNGNLVRADNARLLANLVALSTGDGGGVIFDDMHQGSSDLYDAGAFFRDPRLHASLGLLFCIWLVYLLGFSNRFAPPRTSIVGITPAAFARSVGGFYARSVSSTDAAQALLTRFHTEVRRRLRRPGSEPAWSLLETAANVDPQQLAALKREAAGVAAARSGKPYPRDLRPLAALIHDVQESIR